MHDTPNITQEYNIYVQKCKSKIKGKSEFPITIFTVNATETIKAAAMPKN